MRIPLFLNESMSIQEAIKEMIRYKQSCALVMDHNKSVIGILTERDLMRKIALLELDDKLSYKVSTIMTRDIKFVNKQSLIADIRHLYENLGFRHFPVVEKTGAGEQKIIGLIGMIVCLFVAVAAAVVCILFLEKF